MQEEREQFTSLALSWWLAELLKVLWIPVTIAWHFHLFYAVALVVAPAQHWVASRLSEQQYEIMFYVVILPFRMYLWIILTCIFVAALKKALLPSGMRGLGRCVERDDGGERWEVDLDSWDYVRWWFFDHACRCTKPFIYHALLRRTRLAVYWYVLMGMKIDASHTTILTDLDEVGEYDLWTLKGSGTNLAMRAYGFAHAADGRRVLTFEERKEVRNDFSTESRGNVPVFVAWTALTPTTVALGLAQRWCVGEASSMSFLPALLTYASALSVFLPLSLALAALFKAVVELPCGPNEYGNLVIELVDFIPQSVAFSWLNTVWLRAAGVGVATNNVFSGAPTPRNASLVSISDNVFLSNATITGPAMLSDSSFAGMKARIRPGAFMARTRASAVTRSFRPGRSFCLTALL